MIFVSLGTNDKSFKRLLEKIDREISLGNIKDKVIVQSGYTKYESSNMDIVEHVHLYTNEMNEMDAIKKVAHERGVPKSVVYQEYHNRK